MHSFYQHLERIRSTGTQRDGPKQDELLQNDSRIVGVFHAGSFGFSLSSQSSEHKVILSFTMKTLRTLNSSDIKHRITQQFCVVTTVMYSTK
jgi:hypothetical protein